MKKKDLIRKLFDINTILNDAGNNLANCYKGSLGTSLNDNSDYLLKNISKASNKVRMNAYNGIIDITKEIESNYFIY